MKEGGGGGGGGGGGARPPPPPPPPSRPPADSPAGDRHDRRAPIGADLMGRAVGALARGTLQFRPQPEAGVTYAKKIDKAEARIDWTRPAREVLRHLMGLSPFPGAFFEADLGGGPERVKVLRARLADGAGPPGATLDDAQLRGGTAQITVHFVAKLINATHDKDGKLVDGGLRGQDAPSSGDRAPRPSPTQR